MTMSAQELVRLRRIVSIAEKLILSSPKPKRGRPAKAKSGVKGKRIRRSGKELLQFRKMLKAGRKRGIPVTELARMHRITPAYIYMLG